LVYKYVNMKSEELKNWRDAIGKPGKKMERVNKKWEKMDDPTKCGFVNLKGYTSTYECPLTAMSFAS